MPGLRNITIDNLSSLEREALNKFLKEAAAMYNSVSTDISFRSWLEMLADGIHETFAKQTKGRHS